MQHTGNKEVTKQPATCEAFHFPLPLMSLFISESDRVKRWSKQEHNPAFGVYLVLEGNV